MARTMTDATAEMLDRWRKHLGEERPLGLDTEMSRLTLWLVRVNSATLNCIALGPMVCAEASEANTRQGKANANLNVVAILRADILPNKLLDTLSSLLSL